MDRRKGKQQSKLYFFLVRNKGAKQNEPTKMPEEEQPQSKDNGDEEDKSQPLDGRESSQQTEAELADDYQDQDSDKIIEDRNQEEIDSTVKATSANSKATMSSRREHFEYVPSKVKGERKRIRCRTCCRNPDTVKRMCYRGRYPAICTEEGTASRSEVEKAHIESPLHKECVKAERIKGLSHQEKVRTVPLYQISTSKTKELADKVGKLMVHVYNDAKNLSLSAFSWPARVIASEIAQEFDFNDTFTAYDASAFDLQYVNPNSHLELLQTIVAADITKFKKEIEEDCLAASLRCDASMDRTQKDNQFILMKVVTKSGMEELRYLGLGFVSGRGATGHLDALKEGMKDTIGLSAALSVSNHISTDGENKNVGEHGGLWKLIDDERQRLGIEVPMLKSVCAVHSSALAYKDLCKEVAEVDKMITKLSGISSFFHVSAARTSELENVAKAKSLGLRHFPKLFEVRWSQFTASLIDAVLISWRALMAYCTESDDPQAKNIGKLLSNKDNMQLTCLLGDVLFLLKTFQKRLQSDDITIVDIVPEAKKFLKKLEKLNDKELLGGWEETFNNNYNDEDETFFGITLWQKERRNIRRRNQFVSERRNFNAIRFEILESLKNFMTTRLKLDNRLNASLAKVANFSANDDELREAHEAIAPDIDLATVAEQFDYIRESEICSSNVKEVLKQICTISRRDNYKELATVLARIIACKPHSADCERLVSAYTMLKTRSRSSLNRSTVSNYLYVNINMPILASFDPRPAVNVFITNKSRRMRDTPKADRQEWFKKVFWTNEIELEKKKKDLEEKPLKRKF